MSSPCTPAGVPFGLHMARNANDHPDFLTLPKAAARSGIEVRELKRAIRTGRLPAYLGAGRWARVFYPEVISWMRGTQLDPEEDVRAFVEERLARE